MMPGRCQSLYSRWLEVSDRRTGDLAVRDSIQDWTFGDLRDVAITLPRCPPVSVCEERGIPFLLELLRAWRDNVVFAPVDGTLPPPPETTAFEPHIAHVKTTSGSTGAPRHVLFTADQLMADADQIVRTMGLRENWPNLGAISMAHSYGFSNLVLPLLLHGIPLVVPDDPLPATIHAHLEREPALTVPAVPAMWRAWHQAGILNNRIRLAISAGAPLPLELEQAVFLEAGIKIHNFYGSSECGGIAYDRSPVPRTLPHCAGTPLEGVELEIDPDSGCLSVRSPATGSGYLPDQSTPAEFGNGRFLTSDLATLEADGSVLLLGRTGDAINVAGRKIAPASVEERLLKISGVRHCVVFGVPSPDPARVEEVAACLHLEAGATLEDVREAAAADLSPAEQPRHWETTPELEPDARGKIPRAVWREWWIANRMPAAVRDEP